MSEKSARLMLPFLQGSQAQKHVTHNESLRVLDVLVQAGVASKDVVAPPSLAIDGDAYVVPTGATGDWTGHEDKIAVWSGDGWAFHAPNEGWTVWVSDLDALWSYDGTGWVETAPPESWQNRPMLGINTTADATNRLAVSGAATLLTGAGAGHQLKINKAASGDTASLLFQSDWTGHAEMGLASDTDFSIKTSDGTSWFTALKCASENGRVGFPSGISGAVEVFDTGNSVFIGESAGANDDRSDNRNTFVGKNAGYLTTSGDFNVAAGMAAMQNNTTGRQNTAAGYAALYYNDSGNNNIAVGPYAMFNNSSGSNNTACGMNALHGNSSGANNAALGKDALRYTTTGSANTSFSNCAGIGHATRVSASNQVQLGDSTTTTYAYGAVQDRSDARDKADVRDTTLGLDFITRLRPVDFRWDMRDDYLDAVEEIDPDTGETVTKLVAVPKDGSRKRNRYHHGLIAQEVAAVMAETGFDFGGYQDHNHSGNGEDVLTIGYTELIAPLIKAVQELAAEIALLRTRA